MKATEDAKEVMAAVTQARCAGSRIGLVPTMGSLHAGHRRLSDVARGENDLVIMSIFVNPTQFGAGEDFERYPRNLEQDSDIARDAGIDILFAPADSTMYPSGVEAQTVWVDPSPLDRYLCGASRPGHFRAVSTVVSKLFHIVSPDNAYFGQKDAQQAVVVQRMAQDLLFPVTIRIVPTVRDPDGLALSSRNVYLSQRQRAQALAIPHALNIARDLLSAGERDPAAIESAMRACIASEAPDARIDYVEVADLQTLQPTTESIAGETLIALAVYVGTTRLIDNVIARIDSGGVAFS